MKLTYKNTLISCYICFVIQSLVNNYSPLLFATYQREFSISIDKITFLVSFNFVVQMAVDMLGVKFAHKLGYRRGMFIAHFTSFAGIIGLIFFTKILPPFAGLILSTIFCALGSGLIEVLTSPIAEALPNDEKSAALTLVHSFYCWGQLIIVLLSTLFFHLFGTGNWRMLTFLWALIPAVNGILFLIIPLPEQIENEKKGHPLKSLLLQKNFILFWLLMLCAGAIEQSIAQWSSLFAETGLGVDKTVGDLLGPCMFGLMMALARLFYGSRGGRINLRRFMTVCAVGCFASFMLTVFAPHPLLSLIGCGLTGLFVGIYWPGSLSLASREIPTGGTVMFATLALAGDIGSSLGPGIVGIISERLSDGMGLRGGILYAAVFPLLAFAVLIILKKREKSRFTKTDD